MTWIALGMSKGNNWEQTGLIILHCAAGLTFNQPELNLHPANINVDQDTRRERREYNKRSNHMINIFSRKVSAAQMLK